MEGKQNKQNKKKEKKREKDRYHQSQGNTTAGTSKLSSKPCSQRFQGARAAATGGVQGSATSPAAKNLPGPPPRCSASTKRPSPGAAHGAAPSPRPPAPGPEGKRPRRALPAAGSRTLHGGAPRTHPRRRPPPPKPPREPRTPRPCPSMTEEDAAPALPQRCCAAAARPPL